MRSKESKSRVDVQGMVSLFRNALLNPIPYTPSSNSNSDSKVYLQFAPRFNECIRPSKSLYIQIHALNGKSVIPQPTLLPPLIQTLYNPARATRLTQPTPSQILIYRAKGTINIMVLPGKAPLSPIAQVVELISPVASIPPPRERGLRIARRRLERRGFLRGREGVW